MLRQVLRYARLWYRFQEDYRALKNTKPPVGQALTDEDQQALFAAAQSRPEWIVAYVASALAFYCGLRACGRRSLESCEMPLGECAARPGFQVLLKSHCFPLGWKFHRYHERPWTVRDGVTARTWLCHSTRSRTSLVIPT